MARGNGKRDIGGICERPGISENVCEGWFGCLLLPTS